MDLRDDKFHCGEFIQFLRSVALRSVAPKRHIDVIDNAFPFVAGSLTGLFHFLRSTAINWYCLVCLVRVIPVDSLSLASLQYYSITGNNLRSPEYKVRHRSHCILELAPSTFLKIPWIACLQSPIEEFV